MSPEEICKTIDIRLRPQAEILCRQVFSIADKLEHAREHMQWEELTVEYDNGGGQTGTRENPYFTAYEKLLASYVKSLSALEGMLGEGEPMATAALDDLRARFGVRS